MWESNDPAAAIRIFAAQALEAGQIPLEAIEAICRLRDPDLHERAWQRLGRCTPGPWLWYYRTWLWLSAGRRWSWDPGSDPAALDILPHLPLEGLNRLAAAAAEGSLTLPADWQNKLRASIAASEKPDPPAVAAVADFYATLAPSLRLPWHSWESSEAADTKPLEEIIGRLREAHAARRPFSLIRLGDSEGLFLCGQRHELGGAIANGTRIDPCLHAQGNRLVCRPGNNS